MSRLEWSEIVKRKVRSDSLNELVVPTWTLIKDAINAGEVQDAVELLDYGQSRAEEAYVRLGVMANELLTFIAENVGEEVIERIWRTRYASRVADFMRTAGTVEDFLRRLIEVEIGHHSKVTLIEEPDRYVIRYNPCGSGGRMRRTVEAGTLKKAYPWTWGKVGIPYYCAHCCLEFEILPIELRGYPLAVTEMGEKPEDPCVHLFYKSPELIPERYFARVGKKKDTSKFK